MTTLERIQQDAAMLATSNEPMSQAAAWSAVQKLAEMVEGLAQAVSLLQRGFTTNEEWGPYSSLAEGEKT